jgi:hypothetical protein
MFQHRARSTAGGAVRFSWGVVGVGLVLLGILVAAAGAGQTALPAGNIVKNPGGEFPVGGAFWTNGIKPYVWEVSAVPANQKGVQSVRYNNKDSRLLGTDVSKKIKGGRTYLQGGYPSKVSTAFQTINLSKAAPQISAGGVKACLSAYLGAAKNSPSTARVDLTYLNDAGKAVGKLRVGPVTRGSRLDAGTLLYRAKEGKVPTKTRQIMVTFTATSGPSTNLGAADNISVILTKSACPKPKK